MAKSRKFLTAGAIGVAAFALIGAGASATFYDSVAGTQQLKAGTLNMTVTSPNLGATTDGKTVTFAPFGPTQSTFTTPVQEVDTLNSGDIVASAITFKVTTSSTNAAFRDQVYVKVESWSLPNKGGTLGNIYTGTLAGLEALGTMTISGDVPAGATDPFQVTYYAGVNGALSLTNAAMGGLLTPTITVGYQG